jgi:hypothetical protein
MASAASTASALRIALRVHACREILPACLRCGRFRARRQCAAVSEQFATFRAWPMRGCGFALRHSSWQVVCDVFRLQNQLPDAARIAIRLGDQVPRSTH